MDPNSISSNVLGAGPWPGAREPKLGQGWAQAAECASAEVPDTDKSVAKGASGTGRATPAAPELPAVLSLALAHVQASLAQLAAMRAATVRDHKDGGKELALLITRASAAGAGAIAQGAANKQLGDTLRAYEAALRAA